MENIIETASTEAQFTQAQALFNFDADIGVFNHKALLSSIAHTKGGQIFASVNALRLIPDFNPRIKNAAHEAHIRKIANSIVLEGFYSHKPLACIAGMDGKKPVMLVTEGGCRLEALHLAISEGYQTDTVPVVLQDKATTIEDLTIALVRSNDGKRFTTLELAISVKRLFKYGLSVPTIAEKLDFTVEYVNQLLNIAGAPLLIRQMIGSGEVPAAVALETLRNHGNEAAVILTTAVTAAKANGKTGITRKHLPDQIRKKAITKAAPAMVTAIERVKADAAFETLPLDLKEMIEKIICVIAAGSHSEAQ
ncbi:MAG: hypothetical protein Q8K22_11080 [Rhodoferax sp.]|nr:hypothetical protein [Rhodoferax sp.]